jgi:hypothetical protein
MKWNVREPKQKRFCDLKAGDIVYRWNQPKPSDKSNNIHVGTVISARESIMKISTDNKYSWWEFMRSNLEDDWGKTISLKRPGILVGKYSIFSTSKEELMNHKIYKEYINEMEHAGRV